MSGRPRAGQFPLRGDEAEIADLRAQVAEERAASDRLAGLLLDVEREMDALCDECRARVEGAAEGWRVEREDRGRQDGGSP